MTTAFLAQFWGVSFFILSVLIFARRGIIVGYMKSITDNPGLVFLAGYISLSMGIASVLVHNIWSFNMTGVVTLIGWIALVKGVILMGFPNTTKKVTALYKNDNLISVALFGIMIVGILLIIRGFGL